ncbi:hypothetical protein EV368DRAFT_66897 [Lentinula lateritia]|nr:hypothetical protein EV368DRAFT_66897 [Lentinula lateritia]
MASESTIVCAPRYKGRYSKSLTTFRGLRYISSYRTAQRLPKDQGPRYTCQQLKMLGDEVDRSVPPDEVKIFGDIADEGIENKFQSHTLQLSCSVYPPKVPESSDMEGQLPSTTHRPLLLVLGSREGVESRIDGLTDNDLEFREGWAATMQHAQTSQRKINNPSVGVNQIESNRNQVSERTCSALIPLARIVVLPSPDSQQYGSGEKRLGTSVEFVEKGIGRRFWKWSVVVVILWKPGPWDLKLNNPKAPG